MRRLYNLFDVGRYLEEKWRSREKEEGLTTIVKC